MTTDRPAAKTDGTNLQPVPANSAFSLQPSARRSVTATHWGSFDVVVRDGQIAAIEPAPGDSEASPIGQSLGDTLRHPARITEPMVRQGWLEGGPRYGGNQRGAEPFVAVSWERALDLVAGELDRVRRDHGNSAIYGGSYGWGSAGRFHQPQAQLQRFLALIGGYTRSVNSYSTAAMEVIIPHVLGRRSIEFTAVPTWDEIAADGRLVVSFGGLALKNSQVNYGGLGRHSAARAQQRCRDAGVRFINISPLRDDILDGLDAEWIAPRPGTDVALMLGLAHTIVSEGRHDRDFLDRCTVGFDRFRAYLLGETDGQPKDAVWAAAICEVPAGTIRSLARRIASERTLITISWSLQRADHGEQTYWMAITLAAISGSMGKPAGGFASGYGAVHSIGQLPVRLPAASVSRGQNPVATFIPVARISDLLLHPGETLEYNGQTLVYPDIRLVYWAGGNPFHHHQNLNRLVRAWQQPETIIVHEHWWNPLARHADIVLPAATILERNDFAVGINDGWITAMQRAVDPPAGVLTDYGIFSQLAGRLGVAEVFTEGRDADGWVRHLYEETRRRSGQIGVELPGFDQFWRLGRIEAGQSAPPILPLQQLRNDPARFPLDTPSGKVEIVSETIAGFGDPDLAPHAIWQEPAEWLGSSVADRYPLHLLSNQPKTRLHSQYDHGATSRAGKVADREPITIHPDDAAARGIRSGDVVRVFSDRGACLAGAIVSDRVRPGVVILPTGAWYDPLEPGVPGSLEVHGNPNVLTIDKGTSRLAQGPIAQTCLVEIERYPGDPPPVRAFTPPIIIR